jgi:hypothetical protein
MYNRIIHLSISVIKSNPYRKRRKNKLSLIFLSSSLSFLDLFFLGLLNCGHQEAQGELLAVHSSVVVAQSVGSAGIGDNRASGAGL